MINLPGKQRTALEEGAMAVAGLQETVLEAPVLEELAKEAPSLEELAPDGFVKEEDFSWFGLQTQMVKNIRQVCVKYS